MGPIKEGDRFFRVSHVGRSPRCDWVVVVRVGRKWAEIVREDLVKRFPDRADWRTDRFEIETMNLDGGRFTSPGRVYRTEEEYRDRLLRDRLWTDFRRQVVHIYTPRDLTAINILKAADALGLRLKEE